MRTSDRLAGMQLGKSMSRCMHAWDVMQTSGKIIISYYYYSSIIIDTILLLFMNYTKTFPGHYPNSKTMT
jgi:hypothetical protein